MYIKSGVAVSYGNVVNVIIEIRKRGVDQVGLVADKKKKDSSVINPAVTPSS